jgi:hypothetical protein
MDTKTFHLGDILSVTTSRLLSPRHMDGVYDILNWMTGDSLFTRQLPRAARECAPRLLGQHPDLAGAVPPEEFGSDDDPGSVKAAVDRWLAEQVARFGEYREVAPLADGDHTVIDPVAEMRMINPDAEVITVEIPGDGAA